MAENITELNSDNFDSFIADGNVVIDFWAEWCAPCKILNPAVEEVSKEFDGTVKFGKVDVENNQELAQRFQVMTVPTLIFFKDKEQIDRTVGAMHKEELKNKVDEVF
tara:strand:+ start:1564 stop:1884 length:321 start_codon:yes stop_codon:yes gene_type:complete